MPTFLQLRVTNLCNLRCKMCGQWGDTGIFREESHEGASDGAHERARIQELIGWKRQLALGDYTRLLDEVAPDQPIISLFGGEPLPLPGHRSPRPGDQEPRPDLHGHHQRRPAGGATPGTSSRSASTRSRSRSTARRRSTIASAAAQGSFEKAAAGIRAVARWRGELGRALPMQIAILPITEHNRDAIGPAVEALRQLPLDTINVGLRWFIPTDVGNRLRTRHARGVRDRARRPGRASSFDGSRPCPRTMSSRWPELVRLLKALRRQRYLDSAHGRPWISFVPNVPAERVPEYFSDFGQTFGHDLCPAAWYFAQVEPDGEVCFCGDFPDYFIGNVRRQAFRDIWTGEKAQRFRAKLAKEPLPICARCCGNYVYGKWERPGAMKSIPRSARDDGETPSDPGPSSRGAQRRIRTRSATVSMMTCGLTHPSICRS